jgi:hypothetical protein
MSRQNTKIRGRHMTEQLYHSQFGYSGSGLDVSYTFITNTLHRPHYIRATGEGTEKRIAATPSGARNGSTGLSPELAAGKVCIYVRINEIMSSFKTFSGSTPVGSYHSAWKDNN